MQLPALDQNICAAWTEQDREFYNKLPYYFAKASAQFRKYWQTWPKLFNKIPWTPNQGSVMRRIMVEPTPVLRQIAIPPLISEQPQVDVYNVRERTVDARLRYKQFVSPHFQFLSSFQDFMRGNIRPTRENIDRQILVYEEQFYRTHVFHWAPYVYIAGYGLVSAPQGDPNSTNTGGGKNNAWLQNTLATAGGSLTHLSFKELFKALNAFEEEVGATPYEGSGQPGGDSGPLNEMFCLVTSSITWNQFVDDPWLKENRPLNMNIVTDAFRGNFFNKVRTKLEKYGIRLKADSNWDVTWPAPEVVELNPSNPEYGRTKPNADYSINSQISVSFLIGGPSYSVIEVGPPPADFTSGEGGWGGMNWNGKIVLNKNFLVPCQDSGGATHWDTNSWGHYLRLQAELALGIVGDNRFNVLPIIHLTRVGLSTVS